MHKGIEMLMFIWIFPAYAEWDNYDHWNTDEQLSPEQKRIHNTYYAHSAGYWRISDTLNGKDFGTEKLGVYDCGKACTDDQHCLSYSHCYGSGHCLLMTAEIDNSRKDWEQAISQEEGVWNDCQTYFPRCWIRFFEKSSGNEHTPSTVFKDNVKDIKGNRWGAFKISDGCSATFYESADFSGPSKNFVGFHVHPDMEKVESFALYESTGWDAMSKDGQSILLTLASIGIMIVVCCIACMICPKCTS